MTRLIPLTILCLLLYAVGFSCRLMTNYRFQPRIQNELATAALDGNKEKVKELVKNGADPNGYWSANIHEDVFIDERIIDNLIRSGKTEMLSLFIDLGVDINAVDKQNSIPLIEAVNDNQVDIVSLLIQRGADVNLEGKQGTAMDVVDDAIASFKAISEQSRGQYRAQYECVIARSEIIRELLVRAGAEARRNRQIRAIPVPICSATGLLK